MYKISIIFSDITSSELIESSVNSLQKQSIGFKNLEIILLKNNNIQIKDYPNIKTIGDKEFNSNLLNEISSDYIIFSKEGVIYNENACETLYQHISKEDADMVSGIFKLENEEEENYYTNMKADLLLKNIEENLDVLMAYPCISNKIYKKEFIQKNFSKTLTSLLRNEKKFHYQTLLNAEGLHFIEDETITFTPESLQEYADFEDELDTIIELYTQISDKYPYHSWYILRLLHNWTFNFFKTEMSLDERILLIQKGKEIFKEFHDNPMVRQTNKYEIFYELIYYSDYIMASQYADLIHLSFNNNDHLTEIVKNKEIFMLCWTTIREISGTAKAVFNRANAMSELGYNITLLNFDSLRAVNIVDYYTNHTELEEYFRKNHFINDNIKYMNILENYKVTNTLDFNKKTRNEELAGFNDDDLLLFTDEHVIYKRLLSKVLNNTNYTFYKREVFTETELEELAKLGQDKNNREDIKEILKEKNRSKVEKYMDGTLTIESKFDEEGEFASEKIYTTDGFNFFKVIHEEKRKYYHLSYVNGETYIFNTINEFTDHALEEICKKCTEKPFLTCECSGVVPNINQVNSNYAYKIGFVHGNPFLAPTYGYGSRRREISVLNQPAKLDAVITLTEAQKNDLIKVFHCDNFHTIPNIIDMSKIYAADSKTIEVNRKKMSIFSRIATEKNFTDIIQALKIVVKKHPDVTFEVYGSAVAAYEVNYYNSLKSLIKKFNLEKNVKFHGHIRNVSEAMRSSLFTLFVSKFEGLGMVVLESLANYVPVLAYDLHYGPSEMIDDGVDGFLIEYSNVEQLAEKMIYFFDNPDKAIEMGSKGRELVLKNYSPEKIVSDWEKVLNHVYIKSEQEFYKNHIENLKNKDKDLPDITNIDEDYDADIKSHEPVTIDTSKGNWNYIVNPVVIKGTNDWKNRIEPSFYIDNDGNKKHDVGRFYYNILESLDLTSSMRNKSISFYIKTNTDYVWLAISRYLNEDLPADGIRGSAFYSTGCMENRVTPLGNHIISFVCDENGTWNTYFDGEKTAMVEFKLEENYTYHPVIYNPRHGTEVTCLERITYKDYQTSQYELRNEYKIYQQEILSTSNNKDNIQLRKPRNININPENWRYIINPTIIGTGNWEGKKNPSFKRDKNGNQYYDVGRFYYNILETLKLNKSTRNTSISFYIKSKVEYIWVGIGRYHKKNVPTEGIRGSAFYSLKCMEDGITPPGNHILTFICDETGSWSAYFDGEETQTSKFKLYGNHTYYPIIYNPKRGTEVIQLEKITYKDYQASMYELKNEYELYQQETLRKKQKEHKTITITQKIE